MITSLSDLYSVFVLSNQITGELYCRARQSYPAIWSTARSASVAKGQVLRKENWKVVQLVIDQTRNSVYN